VVIRDSESGNADATGVENVPVTSSAEPQRADDAAAIYPLLAAMNTKTVPPAESTGPAELSDAQPAVSAPSHTDVHQMSEVSATDVPTSDSTLIADEVTATTIISNTRDDHSGAPAADDEQTSSVAPLAETDATESLLADAGGASRPDSNYVPEATSPDADVDAATPETNAAAATLTGRGGFFGRLTGFFSRNRNIAETGDDVPTTAVVADVSMEPQGDMPAAEEYDAAQTEPVPTAATTALPPSANPEREAESSEQPKYSVNDSADPAIASPPVETLADANSYPGGDPQTDNPATTATIDDGKRALAESDYSRAAQIFSVLAEAGNDEAQAHLGYLYYIGEGVAADSTLATEWYRRAAVQGNRDAQYNLAVAYAFGEGVPQDDAAAVLWYRRAAEQGSAIAQYSLGMSYALGEGIDRDDSEALKWYRLAAEQGYAAAQYNLAYGYRTGHGVPVNEEEALRWFAAAASNGHASAQYSLGYMYRSGKGVARDIDEAIRWYRLAADQGHPDARADLASLAPGS
jgi:TPR repeat protein